MHFARLHDAADVVVEIFEADASIENNGVLAPAMLIDGAAVRLFAESGRWRTCGADVRQGWAWTGSAFAEPVASPPSEAELIAHAADRRWRKETGGIVIGGVPIATDDRSKIMIIGARVAAQADPDWTTVWHGTDGGAYPLNAAAMLAISNAVEAHVNGTFATFAIVKADIEASEITATSEIDAAFG